MLKQTVQFTDFDGVNKTKNLYFNLSRTEVIDHIELKDEFEDIRDMIGGEERRLEIHEIRAILELIKKLMKLSYGIQRQSTDGDLIFTKKGVWDDFTETAAYDAFLIGLFEDPAKAVAFLFGIWPKEITNEIDESQLQLPGMPVKMDGRPLSAVPDDAPVAPERVVSTQSNGQGYTREALLAMPKAQFDEIAGTDPQQMSQELLQIAFIRKNSGE